VAGLRLDGVAKVFEPGSPPALDAVTLDVANGEYLCVLGPSGCGKTTLLRLIAGFEAPSSGTIQLGGRTVSGPGLHVPAEARRVGIVFQSYALWPHMSVAGNVGYALKVARVGADERVRRVAAALDAVGLAGFGERAPASLSGGQKQRVALARCLVMEPSVVLLDEPLANLDAHLKGAMEETFAAFHDRTGTTMIHITHDQAEAMALADRVAVFDRGRLVQAAVPETLYREPATAMVAGFVGGGAVVPAEILEAGAGSARVRVHGVEARVRSAAGRGPGPGTVCLRADDLALAEDGIAARVRRATYQGGHYRLEVAPEAGGPALVLRASASVAVGTAVHVALRDGWLIPAG
jgi:iron(III) transport system ATP-binding protein